MRRVPIPMWAVLMFLLACQQADPRDPPGPDIIGDDDDAASDDDDAGDDDDEPTEQIPGAADDGCSSLFHESVLPEYNLEITDFHWQGLLDDYASGVKDYHPVVFQYWSPAGQLTQIDDAMVRLRGNPSFSWLGAKMQFVISFNEIDPDGRFLGLRKITLDASWYDPTVLRDRVAYAYMRHHGIEAPCANNARLSFNGSYYGLYKNVEYVDHEFLERNFGDEDATGVLWKYATTPTANEEYADYEVSSQFWSAVHVDYLDDHTDAEQVLAEWATEVVTPHNDGYWCCAHNFYIYEHPARGILFIPWDLDYAFDATPFWADPYTFYRGADAVLFDAVAADPLWRMLLLDALRDATDSYDPDLIEGWTRDWAAQIAEAFAEDPSKNFSLHEHETAVERLATYPHLRHGWMDRWIDCELGLDVDDDGDGFGSCSDCDDTDAAVFPGAPELCNGLDDDCSAFIDDDPSCDTCHEHAFDDSVMSFCWYPRTWADARTVCQDLGGDLGYPRSSEDWYTFLIHTYWQEHYWTGTYVWWGGATDAGHEGEWTDAASGAPVNPFASWNAGEPGGGAAENCASLYPGGYTWYDTSCLEELPFFCRLQ